MRRIAMHEFVYRGPSLDEPASDRPGAYTMRKIGERMLNKAGIEGGEIKTVLYNSTPNGNYANITVIVLMPDGELLLVNEHYRDFFAYVPIELEPATAGV